MAVNPSTLASLSSLSAVWADNMKLDALNAATKVNSSTVGSTQGTDPQRFWSTPERDADDESEETMEVTLSSERLVNHIQFDLAKFPHDAEVEYFDVQIGDWRPLLRGDSTNGEPCSYSVLECNPPVLPPVSAIDGHNHPQHSFSGHWQPAEFLCRPVRFQRLRVVLKRHRRSQAPCNSRGVRMAFSLAIRGLYCGYKVYSQACVPAPQPVLASYTEHQEIATTTDLLGSQVSYVYRVNRASNILLNDPDTPGTTLIWRSEPQPFPQGGGQLLPRHPGRDGEAQVLDRIFLDPTNDGAHVNLYYSNDEPDTVFEGPDDLLPSNVAVINGQFGDHALSEPDLPVGTPCYVDIDNGPISFRPRRRWWFGCRTRTGASARHDS
jgi:hypothetical protein